MEVPARMSWNWVKRRSFQAEREDVRNGCRVAEGVHVVAYVRPDAETALEVPLSVQDLATPSRLGRQVGVGLEVLATCNVPLAALDIPSYALEEIRVQPLDLFVDS